MKNYERNKYVAEEPVENPGFELNRRDFFRILGGGILILIQPWNALDIMALPAEQARTIPKDFNAFLHIDEDGTVTCYTGKVELGQGVITSLAMMMADELNVPFEKVKMVMGDTDLCPYDAGTWGSQTTRSFGPNMRAAAAEARAVLLDLAAAKLGVSVSQLEVKDGIISDSKNSKNTVTYAQLTKGAKIEKRIEGTPALEDYTKFTYVNKSYKHVDAIQKVTGAAKYTGDLKLPGMVHARIVRPPSLGAKLVSVDVSGAEKIQGVKVVRDGDLIAVLHENRDKADEAVVNVKAEYSFNEMKVNDKTIFDWLLKAESRPNVLRTGGDLETGKKLAETITESEFHNSYVAHSPMEPHTALAHFEGDKITVWAATQTPFGAQGGISRELGMPIEKVRVIAPFVGGGFGGKGAYQQAVEVARLAKLAGKPVMLAWTRDEEFLYDIFRPAAVVKITSGIDNTGKIVLWDFKEYFAGSRGSETTYDVPNHKTTDYSQDKNGKPVHPLNTGAWRAPGNNTNTFARESQMSIMAAKAGIDPLEFRLKNLKDERMIGVLKAAADKFGYKPSKTPSGRGIGIACGFDAGAWVAHIAEVKVDKANGKVQVLRVVCAQDMGLCVNPEGATIQMEGCITMGLGYTLKEEIQFEGGNVSNRGFDTYEIPKFSWIPKIETVILDMKDKPAQGGGEPSIICMGAVIANAVFDATGARLYQLPMTPERVLSVLKKV